MKRALLVLLFVTAASVLSAHEGARATITFQPGSPRTDETCRVRVSELPMSGLTRLGRRVSIVADMPMHAMQPVRATLTPAADEEGAFEGALTFTMPGPWRVTVHVGDANEEMIGALELRVRRDDLPAETSSSRVVVALEDAPRPTILPPMWVLTSAVALAVGMELIAVAYARRRRSAHAT